MLTCFHTKWNREATKFETTTGIPIELVERYEWHSEHWSHSRRVFVVTTFYNFDICSTEFPYDIMATPSWYGLSISRKQVKVLKKPLEDQQTPENIKAVWVIYVKRLRWLASKYAATLNIKPNWTTVYDTV